MNSLNDTFKLKNGVNIPCIGFGTWQTPDGDVAVSSVKAALQAGYRHIDTAAVYNNEKGVGQAIAGSGIGREELFITTKLWNNMRGYETTLKAFDESMKKLGLEYLDLYLIHWPATKSDGDKKNAETWKAFEKLYKEGVIKAIGVSNFLEHHLKPLMENAEIMPMVNQIEYHPGQMQADIIKFCKSNNILVEAWSPLGTGRMLNNLDLKKIAKKYNKSVAQICIRWCLQNNTLPLPKSVTPERIIENANVFDFSIAQDDMHLINNMPYIGGSGLHPDQVNF